MSWSERGLRRRALVRALLGTSLLGLAGCGFKPLYATPETARVGPLSDLASVYVAPLRDRTGQVLRNLLRDRLNPRGLPDDPAYVLEIDLKESIREMAIRSDETATRADLLLDAAFVLSRREDAEVLFRGESSTITSYNILVSQFATYTSEQDARERALRELSDNIRIQLATFFNRVRSAEAS